MCPLESKLSVVHILHYTKSHFVSLAKRHRSINIKKQELNLEFSLSVYF